MSEGCGASAKGLGQGYLIGQSLAGYATSKGHVVVKVWAWMAIGGKQGGMASTYSLPLSPKSMPKSSNAWNSKWPHGAMTRTSFPHFISS